MIQFLWEQSEIPEEMRQEVDVYFIHAPMQNGARPTTADAVWTWLQTAPIKGRYLVISHAPYIHRQDLVMRTLCPKEYTFETVGPEAKENRIAIFLDKLARCINQIYRNNLKNWEFGKEAAQILESGKRDIVREQGRGEDPKFVSKPIQPKIDSLSCFDIYTNEFKTWIFGCAKAVLFADHKRPNISNIRSLMIDEFRWLSRCPKPTFEFICV